MTAKKTTVKKTSKKASKKASTKKTASKKPTKKRAKKGDSLKAQGLDKVSHDANGTPCLSPQETLRWRLGMADSELAKATWKNAEKDVQLFLAGLPEYKTLRSTADAAKHEFNKRALEYMTVLGNLSRELGIDLKKCIINDQTGKITFVDDEGKITSEAPKLGQ